MKLINGEPITAENIDDYIRSTPIHSEIEWTPEEIVCLVEHMKVNGYRIPYMAHYHRIQDAL